MTFHLIKYAQGLVGQYFQSEWNSKLVVWLAGAPGMPSSSESDAALVAQWWYDFVRPDYYGYARSDGFFSPKNCIQTGYDTIQTFRQKIPVFSIYRAEELDIPYYDEIVVVWASYGGWVAGILPKIDPELKEIVLLYPLFGYDDMGQLGYQEETDEEFLRQLALAYKNIYRFEEGRDAYESTLDIWSYNTLSDPSHLMDTSVFLAHGTADQVIWVGRTQQFFKQLLAMNPWGDYSYAEYCGLWHGDCKESGLKGWLYKKKLAIIS